MSQGSTCTFCGFRTEQLMVTCPRCRQQLLHDTCKNCGRCQAKKEENK